MFEAFEHLKYWKHKMKEESTYPQSPFIKLFDNNRTPDRKYGNYHYQCIPV